MTMPEQIAKAIYEGRNGKGCKPWAHQTKEHRAPYLADARHALEAMSLAKVKVSDAGGVAHELRGAPQDIYDTFIAWALKEKP